MNDSGVEDEARGAQQIDVGEVKLPAKITVSAKVTHIEHNALRRAAEKCGVSVSQLIRIAIRRLLREIASRRPDVFEDDLAQQLRMLDEAELRC